MQRNAMRRLGLVLPLTVGIAAAMATPVAARPLDRTVIDEQVSGTEEACGEMWQITGQGREVVTMRAGHRGGAPYFSSSHHGRLIYTDEQDPTRGFVLSSNGIFKDVRIQLISGTTYRFTSMEVGHTSIATLRGRPVAADSGRMAWTFIVDTHGSTNVDDYDLLDATTDAVNGRHLLAEDDLFCDAVADATS